MPFGLLIFWLFVGSVVLQIAYFLVYHFYYTSKANTSLKASKPRGVSVIVCAKNEAGNLRKNLPAILDQDYADFEIVLVNDGSSDDSLKVMEGFEKRHAHVKVVDVKNVETFWGNKKYALTLGIKAAEKPYVVFTDADCQPATNKWLKHIASHFSKHNEIVLGYGAYKAKSKSFINALIRYETVLTAVQYFSYANLGIPYMGVGRNMGYHRDLFFKNSGFMAHMNIMSGDDDLFINKVATSDNSSIVDHPDSFTYSESETSFANWLKQKRRHVSTSFHYKPLHQLLLGLFYISQLGFFVTAASLLVMAYKWPLVLGLIVLRYGVALLVYAKGSRKLEEKGLLALIPVMELALIMSQFFIFSTLLFSKPKYWN